MSFFEPFMCPVQQLKGVVGSSSGGVPTPTVAVVGDRWIGKDVAKYRLSKHKLRLMQDFLEAAQDE